MTLFRWLRNIMAIIGMASLCVFFALYQSGFLAWLQIDWVQAASNAAAAVAVSLGKAVAIVLIALVGGAIVQIIYERMGGK